jgi:TolB-like protein/class 3 adenylate cyclase/Tfp pilus assembly protein PilF
MRRAGRAVRPLLEIGAEKRGKIVEVQLPTADGLSRYLAAVLFVDVVASVRLTELDEEDIVRRWHVFREATTREDIPRHHGRWVKSGGDGMLVEFKTVHDAVHCALDMQTRIQRSETAVPAERGISLRSAINFGEVFRDDVDLYGKVVNVAARLLKLAEARETIVSAAVCDLLVDGSDIAVEELGEFEDLGEHKLKGVEKHVRAFRAWPADAVPPASINRNRRVGDRPSIAVLPFRNISGDPAHDFFGEVIADDLIADLSRLTDLFVISRLSTTPFRDRFYEPRNVAEALGVRYVLSGSVCAMGSHVVLTVELSDAESGHVMWSDRPFRGEVREIFELQGQLSRQIAQAVVPQIRNREFQRVRAKRPDNLTAYEKTLRAIDHLHRTSPEDMEHARTLLESAIAADPDYAAPRAWLARWYVLRVGQGWSSDRASDTNEATRCAEEAIEKDERDPWSLAVRGLVDAYLNKDLEAAIYRYDDALGLNQSAALAWVWKSSALAWLGRGEEAIETSKRAMELSPRDPHRYYFNSIAGTAHAVAGKYEQAIALCRRSLDENPMFSSAQRVLTISLALAGRLEEATRAREDLMKLEPNLTITEWRRRHPGSASEHADRFAEALAMAGMPR